MGHISGATAESYRTPNLSLANNNNKYRAIVSVECNSSSATSSVATVTVTNAVVSPAGIVMNDTFRDTDVLGFDDRSNAPLTGTNSLWYTTDAASDRLVADQNGNMTGTPLANAASLWLGYFIDTNQPPVSLAVGSSVKVTMPFTPSSFNTRTNNAGLRFGVFDYYDSGSRITADSSAVGGSAGNAANVRGYMMVIDFGLLFTDTTPMEIYARNNLQSANLMGTTSDYESLASGPTGGVDTNAPSFLAGQEYTLEFLVKRTGFSSGRSPPTSPVTGRIGRSPQRTTTTHTIGLIPSAFVRNVRNLPPIASSSPNSKLKCSKARFKSRRSASRVFRPSLLIPSS